MLRAQCSTCFIVPTFQSSNIDSVLNCLRRSSVIMMLPLPATFIFKRCSEESEWGNQKLCSDLSFNGTTYCLPLTFLVLHLMIYHMWLTFKSCLSLIILSLKTSLVDFIPTCLVVLCSDVFSHPIAHLVWLLLCWWLLSIMLSICFSLEIGSRHLQPNLSPISM